MDENHEFEINTYHIFNEVLHLDIEISVEAYSEILEKYEILVTRKNTSYQNNIEFLYYDPKKHFYFVDAYERYFNPKVPRNTKESMILGYICRPNNYNLARESKKNLKATLKRELPKRLNLYNGSHTPTNARIDTDDFEEALRWTYDVINFRHSNITLINNTEDLWEKSIFQYFFSLKLATTEFDIIYKFLEYHLERNFQNNFEDFSHELQIIFAKYDDKFLKQKTINFIQKWIERGVNKVSNNTNTKGENKEKKNIEYIKIPITSEREVNDGITSLDASHTALLFEYLKKINVVFDYPRQKELLNRENSALAIQALTGYKSGSIKDHILKHEKNPDKTNIKRVIKILEKIIKIAEQDLQNIK